MSTSPLIQSTRIPGLVMWPNGAIVKVALDEAGNITRDRNGKPDVLKTYGRVQTDPGWNQMGLVAFRFVEEQESAELK